MTHIPEKGTVAKADGKTTAIASHAVVDSETVKSFLFGSDTKLTEKEQTMFLNIAVKHQLDPFKREIYAVKYGSNFNIITGYEVYLKRAERTGILDGWSVSVSGTGADMVATITIHRKDRTHPLVHSVEFSEYNQGNSMWRSKPKTMLKKVAMAQGFRLAFPDELGGMPYTSDELPDKMTTGVVTSNATHDVPETEIVPQNENMEAVDGNGDTIDGEIVDEEPGNASQAQIRKLMAKAKDAGMDDKKFKDWMKGVVGVQSMKQIPAKRIDNLLSKFDDDNALAKICAAVEAHQ